MKIYLNLYTNKNNKNASTSYNVFISSNIRKIDEAQEILCSFESIDMYYTSKYWLPNNYTANDDRFRFRMTTNIVGANDGNSHHT